MRSPCPDPDARRGVRRRVPPPCEQRHDRRDAALDAAVVIVVLELGRHLVADDAARDRIGQRALEAVADLDAHLAILGRHDHQHAVVLALSARASTRRRRRLAYSSTLSPSDRGHRQHHDLVGGLVLVRLHERRDALAHWRREDLGIVDDASGQVRHVGRERRGCRDGERQGHEQRTRATRHGRAGPRLVTAGRPRQGGRRTGWPPAREGLARAGALRRRRAPRAAPRRWRRRPGARSCARSRRPTARS